MSTRKEQLEFIEELYNKNIITLKDAQKRRDEIKLLTDEEISKLPSPEIPINTNPKNEKKKNNLWKSLIIAFIVFNVLLFSPISNSNDPIISVLPVIIVFLVYKLSRRFL